MKVETWSENGVAGRLDELKESKKTMKEIAGMPPVNTRRKQEQQSFGQSRTKEIYSLSFEALGKWNHLILIVIS